MEEVTDPVVVVEVSLCLGQFVVVVGKLEVDTARVDVNGLAQDGGRHH